MSSPRLSARALLFVEGHQSARVDLSRGPVTSSTSRSAIARSAMVRACVRIGNGEELATRTPRTQLKRDRSESSPSSVSDGLLSFQSVFPRVSCPLWLTCFPSPSLRYEEAVSPPPDVTLTTGDCESRTIAPSIRPRKRNGFVSTYIGCKAQRRSSKTGNSSIGNSTASCTT